MGKEKYLKDIEELFKKSFIVNISSIKRIINKKNISRGYEKQLIRNLLLKNKIKKITKGYYTIYNDPSLSVFCFKSAYLGLQDALSFHNLWEQETIPIIITTKKIRQGIRRVMEMNILIRRIDKKYFFGFNYFPENKFYFPYSDIEKTFIDLVYFKENLSKEIIMNIIKEIDITKFNKYLRKYPKNFQKTMLNLLNMNSKIS